MKRRILAVAVLVALVAPAGAAASGPLRPPPSPPLGVLAVVDTGINPYHQAFRDRSWKAYQHPSTYLHGFPRDAVALRLTLDAPDYWTAVRRDCERVWRQVKPGRLYWFPGTRIVGAMSFDLTKRGISCLPEQPAGAPVLDEHGHGTMTASRAAGAPWGACPSCLVVSLQFQVRFGLSNAKEASLSAERSVAWAAANSGWIDAQSNSWGVLPVPDMTGEGGAFFDHPSLTRTVEHASRRHLTFWSSGNGPMNLGVVGIPTVGGHFSPSAIRVGAHDSGQATAWSGQLPHLVADGCDSWAAVGQTLDTWDERHGGGTSAAAPYVAGNAVRMLVAARAHARAYRTGVHHGEVARGAKARTGPLADGVLTLAEWREVLLRTATARPGAQRPDGPPCPVTNAQFAPTPVAWSAVPEAVPAYALVGYGAVDEAAVARAVAALEGRSPVPARPGEDAFFAADRSVREALHPVYDGL